jgi:tRNA pseudouridine13 synthase
MAFRLPDRAARVYISPVTTPTSPLDELCVRQTTLPFVTAGLPGIQGSLKQSPEDFLVEEIPAYLPSGSGEHLYLWVEKRGLNTADAARTLARALGVRPEAASWAGLKDRRAITRQWLSFHCAVTPDPAQLEAPGIRVLSVARHVNKLRTGHLRGNRFRLRLAGVPAGQEQQAEAILDQLQQVGLPAYFGSQRFGAGARNLASAYAWIVEGGRAPQQPFLRKLLVSALQAGLFNAWLAERIEAGDFRRALAGDLLRKEDTGGLFLCEDPELDGERMARFEISATGPMFGARMRAPSGAALERERQQLARFGVSAAHLERVERFGEGTRRPARVRPSQVSISRAGEDLWLEFGLPRGAYATELVSELFKQRDVPLAEEP